MPHRSQRVLPSLDTRQQLSGIHLNKIYLPFNLSDKAKKILINKINNFNILLIYTMGMSGSPTISLVAKNERIDPPHKVPFLV